MDDVTDRFPNAPFDAERAACDPEYRKQLDDEDRKYDDTSDGIDWDEIIATTQDDFEAGIFAFDTRDYPTKEAGTAALKAWIHEICAKAERDADANSDSGSHSDGSGLQRR